MERSDFNQIVLDAYLGEVYGESLFQGLAFFSDTPQAAEGWALLAELEGFTRAVLAPVVRDLGYDFSRDQEWALKGQDAVPQFRGLGYRDGLLKMKAPVERAFAEFSILLPHAADSEKRAVRLLADHERALLDFILAETAGRPDAGAMIRAVMKSNSAA